MRYRSLVFLIAVFGLCSVDLFLRSGRSSRPTGAFTLCALILDKSQAPDPEAIAWSGLNHAEFSEIKRNKLMTVAYQIEAANHSDAGAWFANISK